MRFNLITLLAAAVATVVEARPAFTNENFEMVPGSSFSLKWTNATGAVTIGISKGTGSQSLNPYGKPLASGLTGTSATVTIPADLPSGSYAFTIADESGDQPNYSTLINVKGTSSSSSSASSTSSPTSSASSTNTSSSSTVTSSSSSNSSSATTATTTTSGSSTRTSASTTGPTSTGSSPVNNNPGSRTQSSIAMVLLGAAVWALFH